MELRALYRNIDPRQRRSNRWLCILLLIGCSVVAEAEMVGITKTIAVPMASEQWRGPLTTVNIFPSASPQAAFPNWYWKFAKAKTRANELKRAVKQSNSGINSANPQQTSSGSTSVGIVFPGPVGEGEPPDAMVAAGPNHIVASVNTDMYIYDKSGHFLSGDYLPGFFSSLAVPGAFFDPRLLYDPLHGRFVVIVAQCPVLQNPGGCSAGGSTGSHIFVGISQTSDPTGIWNKYALDFTSTGTWPDFPGLGVSNSALYITSDQASFAGGGAQGWITVISIADLLAGNSTLNITQFQNVQGSHGGAFAMQPAISYQASANEFVLDAVVDDGTALTSSQIDLFTISNSSPPTLSLTAITTPAASQPPDAAQLGTTHLISTEGLNVLSPVYVNNSLWFTQTVADATGGGAIVRWYELDPVSQKITQIGTAAGLGEAYYGAITALPDGEIFLDYSTSSSTQYVGSGYAHRNPTDPAGVMNDFGVYQPGKAPYLGSRWGDLNGISPDPSGSSAWAITEFANQNGRYGTSIASLLSSNTSPDFILSATPASIGLGVGQTAAFTISVNAINGFSGGVKLSAAGLPASASVSFQPDVIVASGSATMTVATSTTPPGHYVLTISGMSGSRQHSTTVQLDVNSQGNPGFSISVSPTSATVATPQSAQFVIHVTGQGGFLGAVSLACKGLPQFASCVFAPPSVNAGGSAELTILTTTSTMSLFPSVHLGASQGLTLLLATLTVIRRKRRSMRPSWLLCGAAMLLLGLAVFGCAGKGVASPSLASPTSGTYSITIVGTSGSLTSTSTLQLTVHSGAL